MLPPPVLEEARETLLALPGVGLSTLALSHRTKVFAGINEGAEADIRALAAIPAHYRVLFLPGGARLQFAMVPMNLLAPAATADYIDTGFWSQLAIKEAAKLGTLNVAATSFEGRPRLPAQGELRLTPGAAYVHITSNNTDSGTEWHTLPEVGAAPLVSDSTSDLFSRPIDISRFGLVYAGAQKNLGPSALSVVIVREDLLARSPEALPSMLSYKTHAEYHSIFNTPPIFGMYLLRLMVKWLVAGGGLPAIARINERKAAQLYAQIDRSSFYEGIAAPDSRSLMNVTFRLTDPHLESRFVATAANEGLHGLAGDPVRGGLRASIYNAVPEEAVDALVQFMREFERTHG